MRVRRRKGDFSVHAIAGTYVVMLGFNARKSATKGLLGFAIHRSDLTENENYWLRGFKTFEETAPDVRPGSMVSTLEHPVQSFFWGDYTAKPAHEYVYTVVPIYGEPKNIVRGKDIRIKIKTECEDRGTHAIYFNRGVAASQAYVWKYGYKKPEKVANNEALDWLSRGLETGLLDFIKKAKGRRYALRGAFYEFEYIPVLKAFGNASNSGADVKIVYDARKNPTKKDNEKAIRKAGISGLMVKRKRGKSYIAHNKFLVLIKNGKAKQVWTGSTNITNGGIFGQGNVGHIIRDEKTAEKYHDYWRKLSQDPSTSDLRKWNMENTSDPKRPILKKGITPIFSPRLNKQYTVLNWYAECLDNAKQTINLTAAFGVNPLMADVLGKDKAYLRYLLLEKPGKNYGMLCRDIDVRIAIGSKLSYDYLYRWMREKLTGYNRWVSYIHTKFLLIDPLSDNPTVITGSANFSEPSTIKNDENMLVIQGNKRVADIYLGEFMRLFNHFYFRSVVTRQSARQGSDNRKSSFLKPDDSWCKRYYQKGSLKQKQRLLFA